ncbi:ABC transporter substrate-binding protein [Xylophilus sp. ASV27]|uniref:ABC transporter substrate-binding protein n=1 Tax=Xylophilus sp. ASV27 TaxID=2795129 RepID=UPI001E3CD0D4|nr:ABC transporter substrate-binding protein [Xylophilus sp. ASV27]
MHRHPRSWRRFWWTAGIALLPGWAWPWPTLAQEPAIVTVAHVAPLTGPVGIYSQSVHQGMGAYFQWVNSRGGVRGHRIDLVGVDIPYDLEPAKVLEKYAQTASRYKPVAFAYPISSQVFDALVDFRTLTQLGVPIVGTIPQMYPRRGVVNPLVFFVGASDIREVTRIVEHMGAVGRRRIAVAYWDDSNNQGLLAPIRQAAAALGMEVVGAYPIAPTGTGDLAGVISSIKAQQPQGVVCLMPAQDTVRVLTAIRADGSTAALYGPSYNDPGLLPPADRDRLRGVAVAQIVPNPNHPLLPLAQEFRTHFTAHASNAGFNSYSFQGYIAARLIVQALNRCANPKNPACLRDELEKTGSHDLGGLTAHYSPTNHDGLSYVDIGMVSWSGKVIY